MQSLPQWLIKHALPAVIALIAFLLLALWRVIPRFGPLQPAAAPDRRSLVEHLSAMGRFYSMQKQLPKLLHTVASGRARAVAARAPETRGQDGATRLKSAARLTGLRPRELLQAFTAPPTTPHEFILAMRTLAAFREQLTPHGIATRPQRPRGRLPPSAGPDRRRDHKTRAEFDRAFSDARTETEEHYMSETTGTDLGSQALRAVDAMRTEVAKALIGQGAIIDQVLIALLAGGHVLIEGVPGLGKTLLVQGAGQDVRWPLRAHPVHARPDAGGRHRPHVLRSGHARVHAPARGRCSPTCCWPTRSTARRPRRRPRCSK